MKPVLQNILILISVIFSLGGAFNVGGTRFLMAVPFMTLLGYLTFKKNRTIFISSVVFILVCVGINVTIYKNQFVFPVLQKGVHIKVVDDSLYRKHDDESGSFITSDADDVYLNKPTREQEDAFNNFLNDETVSSVQIIDSAMGNYPQVIYKLKKDQEIAIKGVYNFGGVDSKNRNYLITEFGNISEEEIERGNIQILPEVPVQSGWSRYVGNLMYWPILPIAILSIFN